MVPIDECYKLVGLIRLHWHGLSGGTEVWREVAQFFAELRTKGRRGWRESSMPELNFQVEKSRGGPLRRSTGAFVFKLRVTNSGAEEAIHTVVLRAQIQIEVTRRHYSAEEQARLLDLFGEPERWGATLRNLLWTHASGHVPPFQKETVVEMQVPCTFDFNVARDKIFSRPGRRRFAAEFSFQRHGFLPGPGRRPPSGADFLGKGSEIQASAESVERADRPILSEQRVAVPAARCLSNGFINTKSATEFLAGKRPSSGF